jgi:hypothetical protein
VLVYEDWRAESPEQYEVVARLVARSDRVFVRMHANGTCEAVVLHWGLLDRYTVERDGYSVKGESREIIRRRLWSIGFACTTVAAVIVSLWFAGPTLEHVVVALWVCGIVVLMVFRVAMLMVEGPRARAAVPGLRTWMPLGLPDDGG